MGKGFDDDFGIDFDGDSWASGLKPKISPSRKAFNLISGNRKVIVGIASFVIVLLAILTYTNFMTSKNFREASDTAYTPAYKVRYQELGSQVISNYFSGLPSPTPLSSDVSWSGGSMPDEDERDATKLQSAMDASGKAPVITGITLLRGEQNELPLTQAASLTNPEDFSDSYQETLTYYITMNGQPMEATISFLTPNRDSDALPILLSAPTVTPFLFNDEEQKVTDNPMGDSNMVEAKVNNEGLNNVVGRFVTAYAKNDQNTLQQLTQDSQGRKFVGIGGFESKGNHQVLWSYNDTTEENSRDKAVVRIRFTMTQTVKGEDDSEDSYDVEQEMDLLVHDVRSNLPAIVSWGPAGTWRSLSPFSVARDSEHMEQSVEDDSDNDVDSPTTSESTSTESTTTKPSSTSKTTQNTTQRTTQNNDVDSPSGTSGNSGGNMEMDSETCKLLGLDC